jgi:uncharacterized protein YrzB (UPF0473 family)
MKQKIYLNDGNQDMEYTVIAKWSNNQNNYIAYSKENDSNILVSKCSEENGEMKLYDIDDDNEWQYVNNFLNTILNEDGVFNE